jgi:hypothetical protein
MLMSEFVEVQRALGLKKFCDSPLGTLYAVPYSPGVPRVMVRRFDRELPVTLVQPFAEFVQAAQRWIDDRPALVRLVRIEQPVEVGRDFISRNYLLYYTSTDAYVDWEDPPEPPEELEQMRSAFREAAGKSADPKDIIIEAVLARSLLEPTGKTVFNEEEGRFIVVEPKMTREDVERWAALGQ